MLDKPLFTGYVEDPTLFLDKNGVIHMIAHGELPPQPTFNVGVHAVSVDGRQWSAAKVAYTLWASWSNQTTLPHPELGRREAPQMLLSNDDNKRPIALTMLPCRAGAGTAVGTRCNWVIRALRRWMPLYKPIESPCKVPARHCDAMPRCDVISDAAHARDAMRCGAARL